jgi:hypothetical protein
MEPELWRFDKEWRLLDDDGWCMINGRGRGDGHDSRRPVTHIDSDVEIDVGGEGVGYGEGGDKRQAEQNPFHSLAPFVV